MDQIPYIEKLFFHTAQYIDLLPILLFLIFLNKNKHEQSLWFIFASCVFSLLIINIIDYFSASVQHYLTSLFTLTEFLLFSSFLHYNIIKKQVKLSLVIIVSLFVIFLLTYTFTDSFKTFDSIPIGIETILMLFFSFYFLYEQMNNPKEPYIYNDFRFWIIFGFAIYLGGSFFIYIFADQIERSELKKFWFLTHVFYILKDIFFAIGIIVHSKKSKARIQGKNIPFLDFS